MTMQRRNRCLTLLLFPILTSSVLVTGCVSNSDTLPKDAGTVASLSHQALTAYQNGDKRAWQNVVCDAKNDEAPLDGWNNMRALVGDISNPRLIAISGGSSAGNAGIDLAGANARYQVTSSKYPLKELVLTFYVTDRDHCVGLLY
ncbi:hypothetical protein [Burkholderia cepacia]|uniref:hypothetical protein n=1 Tax=Burkholderia cepacia TaxID=292 RepID=UPI001294CAD8|nr:hypothetical protein [Burkholderia cepacia]